MDNAQTSTRQWDLPLEVVERILDHAGCETAQICLLVSKKFHAAALHTIYEDQGLILTAPRDALWRQLNRLFGSQDSGFALRDGGRHVRKLSVRIEPQWPPPQGFDIQNLQYEEDIVYRLLETFSQQPGLHHLTVLGLHQNFGWHSIPPKIRQGLVGLVKLPNLSLLHIQNLREFPIDILHGHESLRCVRIVYCHDISNKSGQPVVVPNVERLGTHELEGMASPSNGLLVPTLKHLKAQHRNSAKRSDSWIRIDRSRETLQTLVLTDNAYPAFGSSVMKPALPDTVKISDIPELGNLCYVYRGAAIDETNFLLEKVLHFFEGTALVARLHTLSISLHLDQWAPDLGEDFWKAHIPHVMEDESWAKLDNILASRRYPCLSSVSLNLRIFNSVLDKLDSDVISDAYPERIYPKPELDGNIQASIAAHFVKLREHGVEVNVGVSSDF